MSMRLVLHLVAAWALLINLGCPASQSAPAGDTPKDQLTIEQLEFSRPASASDEWAISAERASGDLGTTRLENVTFNLERQGKDAPLLEGKAVSGLLDISKGHLALELLELHDIEGARITMPKATLSGESGTLTSSGPVTYTRDGLSLKASTAEFTQKTGTLTLSGPVVGTISQPEASKP